MCVRRRGRWWVGVWMRRKGKGKGKGVHVYAGAYLLRCVFFPGVAKMLRISAAAAGATTCWLVGPVVHAAATRPPPSIRCTLSDSALFGSLRSVMVLPSLQRLKMAVCGGPGCGAGEWVV